MSAPSDWRAWHADYADPRSALSQRLAVVQDGIDRWLETTAPRPVIVVSSCAGDGRDLLGVLGKRADADRVTATLIENDPRNAADARARIRHLGLAHVHVRETDAGSSDAYLGAAPADLVLLCGIFGNVSDADVERTIAATPTLCRPEALVIWTRHRREPDLTPAIRGWVADQGFDEEAFVAPTSGIWSVGITRFRGVPRPPAPGRRLFTFVR